MFINQEKKKKNSNTTCPSQIQQINEPKFQYDHLTSPHPQKNVRSRFQGSRHKLGIIYIYINLVMQLDVKTKDYCIKQLQY